MKIAVASDDQRTISPHFGRTRGFVIFEIENNAVKNREYRLNTFTGHARGLHLSGEIESLHSHNHHGPILEALRDCQVVISNGMGRRIYEDLKGAGIEALVTDETDVKKALDLYLGCELVHRPEIRCPHKDEK